MFKKRERVTAKEFVTYLKQAKRHHFPHLTILIVNSEQRKVAVVVGKKISRLAIKRNTIKRRALAVLREGLKNVDNLGILIVLLKPSFATLSRQYAADELREAIADIFKTT